MDDTQSAPLTVFISHKTDQENTLLARGIVSLLSTAPMNKGINFFLSETITKGDDWRGTIQKRLRDTEYLFFIYTDPKSDWSWCVYETTIFTEHMKTRRGSQPRMYCFHFDGQKPPDPFERFETIAANQNDIEEWVRQFCSNIKCQLHENDIKEIARKMTKLFEGCRPKTLSARYLQPSISIRPRWSEDTTPIPNWSALELPDFPVGLSEAEFTDDTFMDFFEFKPPPMKIVDFLLHLDADHSYQPWIQRLLDSLQATIMNQKEDQNIVFFRASSGKVIRPILRSIARSDDGRECECRLMLVEAFSSPPTDEPSQLVKLANGLRMAVRIRIELLDKYEGRMAEESARLAESNRSKERKYYSIGGRVIETFRNIVMEARLYGTDFDRAPFELFGDKEQIKYKGIHDNLVDAYQRLQQFAQEEDAAGGKAYPKCECVLKELRRILTDYFQLAIPRFSYLLSQPSE